MIMNNLQDISPEEITEISVALTFAAFCQKAVEKVDLMTDTYADRITFPYFILERGNPEWDEDPNLMYLALSKSESEKHLRISLSQKDSDAIILHLRDVYFAGVKDLAVTKRNAILAKADELANPAE